MNEQVVVKAWGNSRGIRLPKKITDLLGIGIDDKLIIEIKGDSIILKKAFAHKSFKERLEEYDGKIEIEDFDWGEPKGREFF